MKALFFLLLALLAVSVVSAASCHEALQSACPLSRFSASGQRACYTCTQRRLHELLPCSQSTLQSYCEQAVHQSFWDIPTQQDPDTGLFLTDIPVCSEGGSKVNCWEQTHGEGRVTFLKQTVSSDQFPCKSGQSSTTFLVDSNVQMTGGPDSCTMDVKGFGGKEVSVGLCQEASRDNLYIGFDCPTSTGQIQAVGPSGKCDAGYGSYTATIKCPDFQLVTYIKY